MNIMDTDSDKKIKKSESQLVLSETFMDSVTHEPQALVIRK